MANDLSKRPQPQPRRGPVLATVVAAGRITRNMIRVTMSAREFAEIPPDCAGGHCKLMLPAAGQSVEDFAQQLIDGPKPVTRTYTVRHARPDAEEIDVDFVAHGDDGPASAWAARAQPGDVVGFAGPGAPKLTEFDADFYLFAADMSAIPVVAAGLEALPPDAMGVAIFEIISPEDRQEITAPPGISQHWLIHDDPHKASRAQIQMVEAMPWPEGRVRTLIAGETGVVRSLRLFLRGDMGVDRRHVYASGYWRIGLAEDEHQKVKRAETEADEAQLSQTSGG